MSDNIKAVFQMIDLALQNADKILLKSEDAITDNAYYVYYGQLVTLSAFLLLNSLQKYATELTASTLQIEGDISLNNLEKVKAHQVKIESLMTHIKNNNEK